jgi:hypothetical protein
MKCISDKNFISFLSNEIKPSKKRKIEKHLRICQKCRKKMCELEKILEITEEFVQKEKSAIHFPRYEPELQWAFAEPEIETQGKFIWIKHWWKSAAAMAAVAAIVFAIIFVSSIQKVPEIPSYLVLNNEYGYTEAYLFNEDTFTALEEVILEEIYQDEELRNEILYGTREDIEDIIEMLPEDDIKFFEKEISKKGII